MEEVIQFHADALGTSYDQAYARLGANYGKLAGAVERPRMYA